jgi:N-acetyl-alpha-D-muramate 1-phosphate uridylyltransferase
MTLDTIMIFAAGRGTRMRELTDDLPKPLIPVAGKPLIDHALELADGAGIDRKLVNTHYLGQKLAAHLKTRNDVLISHENGAALETGGGLKHALPLIDRKVVMTLNPDAVWTGRNPLTVLADSWQADIMDALLMLVPVENATGHKYDGDFIVDSKGRISRITTNGGQAFVFTGAQIVHTDLLQAIPQDRFSFNLLWDQLIAKGRLFSTIHHGGWADVGTPEGLNLAEHMLRTSSNV